MQRFPNRSDGSGKQTMDTSFLSRAEVVTAAKKFICIRLTSYEDETEKAFIGKLVKGEIGNTAFAILSPDGKPVACGRGPGRGPGDLFKDAADMAKGMDAIAEKHPAKKVDGVQALPVTLTPLLGLVVAASDKQPLVVVLAEAATNWKRKSALWPGVRLLRDALPMRPLRL
jgi:hypothetical protein